MAHAGQVIENPVSDERMVFRRTAAETTAVCSMLALLLLAAWAGINPAPQRSRDSIGCSSSGVRPRGQTWWPII